MAAHGPGRCAISNGGCWSDTKDGITLSACSVQYCYLLLFVCISFLVTVHNNVTHHQKFHLVWHITCLTHCPCSYQQESQLSGCRCPPGFHGDGHTCEGAKFYLCDLRNYFYIVICDINNASTFCYHCFPDVDECKEHLVCQCDGCSCKNKWGGFDCKCKGNQIYIAQNNTCIGEAIVFYFWNCLCASQDL